MVAYDYTAGKPVAAARGREGASRTSPAADVLQLIAWSRSSARTPDRTRKPPVTTTSGGMSRSTYVNVKKNAAELTRMLEFSKGRRAVPVIVEDETRDDRLRRHLRGLTRPPDGRSSPCSAPNPACVAHNPEPDDRIRATTRISSPAPADQPRSSTPASASRSTWPTSTPSSDGGAHASIACSSRTATPITPAAPPRSRPHIRRPASSKRPWPERRRPVTRCPGSPLSDGDLVPAGDDQLTVLHTPGHSPDHLAFWHEPSAHDLHRRSRRARQQRDDSLEPRRQSVGSTCVARTSARCWSHAVLLPAHGPRDRRSDARSSPATSSIGACASSRCSTLCAPAGRRVQAIAESIYDGLDPALLPAAHENVRAHLEKLEAEGRSRQADRWTC